MVVSTIILARSFETSSFAAYTYFQLTIAMFSAYAAMGLEVTASRYFAEIAIIKSDRKSPPASLIWMISIGIGVIASLTLFAVPQEWLTAGLSVPRWILVLGVFALTINVVPSGGILGLQKYKEASLISGGAGLVMVSSAVYATMQNSIDIAMLGVIFAVFLHAVGQSILIVIVCGFTRLHKGLSFKYEDFRLVFGFAGPMFLVSLLSASGAWLVGRLILNATNEYQFSLYTIGMQWYALGLLLPGVVSRVILPRLVMHSVHLHAENTKNSISLVRMSAGLSLLLAIGMLFAVLIFSPWLVSLYGDKYTSLRWLLFFFGIAAMFSAPVNSFGNALVANNGQFVWLQFTIVSTAVLIVTTMATESMGVWAGVLSHIFSALTLSLLAILALRYRQLI